jgi:hypothetical protein
MKISSFVRRVSSQPREEAFLNCENQDLREPEFSGTKIYKSQNLQEIDRQDLNFRRAWHQNKRFPKNVLVAKPGGSTTMDEHGRRRVLGASRT